MREVLQKYIHLKGTNVKFKFDKESFKKEFNDTVMKTATDKKQLMRLSRILGTKYSIRFVCVITSLLIFFTGNYLINLFGWLFTRSGSAFSIFNFFRINFKTVGEYGFIQFLYIVLLLFIVFNVIRTIYLFRINLEEQNVGQKGVSRFTTIEEIKQQFKCIDDKESGFSGRGGIPVCRVGDKLYIDDDNTNVIHVGITRSGKGEMFVIPEIDIYSRAELQPSMLILDMKSELIKSSYTTLEKRGYNVQFLNLECPSQGMQYNPLSLITQSYKDGDTADAELLCNAFAYSIFSSAESSSGDSNAEFFLSNATSAVSALILAHIADCLEQDQRDNARYRLQWYKKQTAFKALSPKEQIDALQIFHDNQARLQDGKLTLEELLELNYIPHNTPFAPSTKNEDCINMFSIINTFSNLARDYINDHLTKLDIYFQSRPALDRAKGIYASIEVSGDRTKGSIFSQALTKLNLYAYDNIAKMTSKSTLDLTELGFGEKPVALFIGIPFHDRSKDSLVSTLIGQVFSANSRRASRTTALKCQRPIIYQLDEVGNYPAIMNFKTMISVGLGTDQLFNLFIQSYNQIDSTYGKDAATIKDNCGTHIYIQTISKDTAEYFSALLGNETITNITRTGKPISLDKTVTEMYDEKPLLNMNELMELRPGENVIKRVMKRMDLSGAPVKPRPIFNNIESGTQFLYRYQYLSSDFPDASSISLSSLPIPNLDFEQYDLDDKVYDYEQSFKKYAYDFLMKKAEQGETLDDEEIYLLRQYKIDFQFDQLLINHPQYAEIQKLLHDTDIVLGKKTTIAKLLNLLSHYNLPEESIVKIYDLLVDTENDYKNIGPDTVEPTDPYREFADFYKSLENMD